MISKLLEKAGLKYEDLNPLEKETLHVWVDRLQKGAVSVETVRQHISIMKHAVENDLAKHDLGSKQDLFLKARLRNYMLLEAFLSTPEMAREQLENAISTIVSNKG